MILIGDKSFEFGDYIINLDKSSSEIVYELQGVIKLQFDINYLNMDKTLFTDKDSSPFKTLKSYLYKNHNLKLEGPQFINKINLILSKLNQPTEFKVTLTPNMDWKPGTYNDEGSCFFTFNSGGRYIIPDHGGCFIRVSSQADPNYGRCMALPAYKHPTILTIFNYYKIKPEIMGALLGKLSDCKVIYHPLSNKQKRVKGERSVLYANTTNNVCVGNVDDHIDYYWKIEESDYITYRCPKCGLYVKKHGDPCGGNLGKPEDSWPI